MTPVIRQMTAAAFLPPMASVEIVARISASWTRAMTALLRPSAASLIPALPSARPAQAMLAAPEQAAEPSRSQNEQGGGSDAGMTDVDAGGMEEAREVLAGDEPPEGAGTIATGEGRAEETGGPTEDTTTLVEGATGKAGKRQAPDGAVS